MELSLGGSLPILKTTSWVISVIPNSSKRTLLLAAWWNRGVEVHKADGRGACWDWGIYVTLKRNWRFQQKN